MPFEPRQIVNGALLRQFIGKSISICAKVDGDLSGQTIKAKTTDNIEVKVALAESLNARPSDWLEIIGTPVSGDTIRAREVIVFEQGDQEFDVEGHNILVQLLHHCKDVYKQG